MQTTTLTGATATSLKARAKISLARQTILRIAGIVIVVTVITTLLTYLYLFSSLETQYTGQLEKYISERGEREQNIFTLAQDNQEHLKTQFLQEYAQAVSRRNDSDINREFDRLFVKQDDGATRNRPEGFNGTQQVGMYISPKVALTPETKLRILTYYNLAASFGPAWHTRFQDIYFGDPEGVITVYWPEYPTWAQDTKADYDITKESWFYIGDPAHDPERKMVWTGVYQDSVSKLSLISSETPIDLGGKHIASIGQDITLNELIDRSVKDHLNGAYNLIIQQDGHVIAHPQFMELIKQNNSDLDVNQLGDPHVKHIYELLKAALDPKTGQLQKTVISDDQDGEYLAVDFIKGPDWFFVTAVPKSVLGQTAFETARFILLLGVFTMLLELLVLWVILQRLVARPLRDLTRATEQVANGDLAIKLNTTERNELGQLAAAFNTMAEAVGERETRLMAASSQVLERAAELKVTASQQAAGSQQQASALTQVNSSVNELSSTAMNVSRLAQEVKQQAQQVAEASRLIYDTTNLAVARSEQGQQAVDHTVTVSVEASHFYENLLLQMEELQSRSSTMRRILDLISSIAGETHLLSLNAAIEAAGAGNQGERFRVVAQEVKQLAQRSNSASRDVVEMVQQIEAVIEGVVTSVETSYTKIQELTQASERAGAVIEELRQVAEQAERQAESINQVAKHSLMVGSQIEIATQQQGSASQQVLGVLSELSATAQQNAEGSGQLSATAVELEEVSRHLSSSFSFSEN
jgi:methyl-accepting chemotaxis protein